jgi:hypothetical protein
MRQITVFLAATPVSGSGAARQSRARGSGGLPDTPAISRLTSVRYNTSAPTLTPRSAAQRGNLAASMAAGEVPLAACPVSGTTSRRLGSDNPDSAKVPVRDLAAVPPATTRWKP